ncbi:MAG: nodulation protein NfeD, partial [Elusimicrobiota bacterium]
MKTKTRTVALAVTAALTWMVIRAQMRGVVTGIESLAGQKGLAKSALTPKGTVLSEGELWT